MEKKLARVPAASMLLLTVVLTREAAVSVLLSSFPFSSFSRLLVPQKHEEDFFFVLRDRKKWRKGNQESLKL